MKHQPTLNDVMEVLQVFSGSVDGQFLKINERFEKMDERFEKIEQRLDKIDHQMVTKDYLDQKLGDLHYDLVMRMRKEDEMVLTKVAKMIG